GDGFSVVLMAAPPRRIVPEPAEDGQRVSKQLQNVHMTHGNADLVGTLKTVASMLQASPAKYPAKEVYFLTDLQRSGWVAARPGDLPASLDTFKQRGAKAIFVDVGRDGASNLAVTNIELGDPVATTTGQTAIIATLVNYGTSRDEVNVRLFVGRAKETDGDE